MIKTSTMDDFSKNAVESFVQTVVFVDDKIYAPPPDGKVLNKPSVFTPRTRKPATKKAALPKASEKIRAQVQIDPPPFSPHDIQASFAKKNIVCSLHQPAKTASVGETSIAYKLCASADIVIVDWDLYGDAGVKATDLTETLVTKSLQEDPHQLRLILIYTDNPNLFAVSNEISEKLIASIPDEIEYKEVDEGLAFHTPNARVVVLGKPAVRIDKSKHFEVDERDLADKAIEEFCKLTDGLLQGGILMGLAAIRKQSRKILFKFNSDLDGAFLTHRALGLPHEEAFDHITPLLMAEIEAVLEDSLPHPLVKNSILENWCDNWTPSGSDKSFIGKSTICPKQFAKDFCLKGMDINKIYDPIKLQITKTSLGKTLKRLNDNSPKWPSVSDEPFQTLSTYLSENTEGSDLRELSLLMSQRTYYDGQRYLAQGTIIREKGDKQRVLVCLQPACDSIRLKEVTSFIFCAMTETTKEKASHVVRNGDGFSDLLYKPKVEDCVTLEFKPTKGRISATELEFTDANGQSYQWVAQLKPKHARQAVERFARELGRVGLTESEWLRLKAK